MFICCICMCMHVIYACMYDLRMFIICAHVCIIHIQTVRVINTHIWYKHFEKTFTKHKLLRHTNRAKSFCPSSRVDAPCLLLPQGPYIQFSVSPDRPSGIPWWRPRSKGWSDFFYEREVIGYYVLCKYECWWIWMFVIYFSSDFIYIGG